jgi:hypothetical protein
MFRYTSRVFVITHLVIIFLSHRVYGARNSVYSPESHQNKDFMFTNIVHINWCLPQT